jgi:hypothetical protein
MFYNNFISTAETRKEEMICEIAYPRPERVYPHALLLQLKVNNRFVLFNVVDQFT